MKKAMHCFALVFLAFILMIGDAACMKNPKKPKSTETSGASSSPEVPTKSDREIVEAVWNEIQGTDSVWDGEGIDHIGENMKLAEALSGKLFGGIISEEDAKEKGKAAIIELSGSSENENEQYKRPFEAKLYEKYDVWFVNGTPPPGYIDSEGREYPPPPASVPYIIMRSSDGKVLAFGIF